MVIDSCDGGLLLTTLTSTGGQPLPWLVLPPTWELARRKGSRGGMELGMGFCLVGGRAAITMAGSTTSMGIGKAAAEGWNWNGLLLIGGQPLLWLVLQ